MRAALEAVRSGVAGGAGAGEPYAIMVDGGINEETARACADAGATALVAGVCVVINCPLCVEPIAASFCVHDVVGGLVCLCVCVVYLSQPTGSYDNNTSHLLTFSPPAGNHSRWKFAGSFVFNHAPGIEAAVDLLLAATG